MRYNLPSLILALSLHPLRDKPDNGIDGGIVLVNTSVGIMASGVADLDKLFVVKDISVDHSSTKNNCIAILRYNTINQPKLIKM